MTAPKRTWQQVKIEYENILQTGKCLIKFWDPTVCTGSGCHPQKSSRLTLLQVIVGTSQWVGPVPKHSFTSERPSQYKCFIIYDVIQKWPCHCKGRNICLELLISPDLIDKTFASLSAISLIHSSHTIAY